VAEATGQDSGQCCAAMPCHVARVPWLTVYTKRRVAPVALAPPPSEASVAEGASGEMTSYPAVVSADDEAGGGDSSVRLYMRKKATAAAMTTPSAQQAQQQNAPAARRRRLRSRAFLRLLSRLFGEVSKGVATRTAGWVTAAALAAVLGVGCCCADGDSTGVGMRTVGWAVAAPLLGVGSGCAPAGGAADGAGGGVPPSATPAVGVAFAAAGFGKALPATALAGRPGCAGEAGIISSMRGVAMVGARARGDSLNSRVGSRERMGPGEGCQCGCQSGYCVVEELPIRGMLAADRVACAQSAAKQVERSHTRHIATGTRGPVGPVAQTRTNANG